MTGLHHLHYILIEKKPGCEPEDPRLSPLSGGRSDEMKNPSGLSSQNDGLQRYLLCTYRR